MKQIKHRTFKFFTLLTCLLAIDGYCLEQQQITTLQLHNIQPELLLPTIKAHLSTNSSASVYKNQLILNVTDKELATIQQLINQLDIPGKQLLISIKKAGSDKIKQQQGEINLHYQRKPKIQTGNTNTLRLGSETKTTITINPQNINQSTSLKQGIRATEGSPVLINTGTTLVTNNQPLINANSGFFATAWVNGNSVTVKIIQQQQNFKDTKTITRQQLHTQVTGGLNHWIPIGSIVENSNTANHLLNIETLHNTALYYIKVELLE